MTITVIGLDLARTTGWTLGTKHRVKNWRHASLGVYRGDGICCLEN
jgi:hypothetical protein